MKKILVIGDQCTDRFVYGECKRLSPEAPVPVFTPVETVSSKGMASNVAANLRVLTKEYEVEEITQKETIVKTRYVDARSNHMFLRVDEESEKIKPLKITGQLEAKIREADAVIVSDYNKGFLDIKTIDTIGSLAKFSFLDTKKVISPETIKNYTFVKWNESEFLKNKIVDPSVISKIIVTLGSRGAKHNETYYPSSKPRETIDVSGAGDTFLAAFAYYYLFSRTVSASIRFANDKASEVVQKKGIAVP